MIQNWGRHGIRILVLLPLVLLLSEIRAEDEIETNTTLAASNSTSSGRMANVKTALYKKTKLTNSTAAKAFQSIENIQTKSFLECLAKCQGHKGYCAQQKHKSETFHFPYR